MSPSDGWIFSKECYLVFPPNREHVQRERSFSYCQYLAPPCLAQVVKNLPAMQENGVRSLSWEDPLEKEMATHSSLQPPCLKNPMDRGAWRATVHGVAQSPTRLKWLKQGRGNTSSPDEKRKVTDNASTQRWQILNRGLCPPESDTTERLNWTELCPPGTLFLREGLVELRKREINTNKDCL